MSGSYALERGPRVRLRLATTRDAAAIRALLERQGIEAEEVEIARLVRSDPRRRLVICATALIGSAESLGGIGAIDLDGGGEPDTLYVDDSLSDELAELLSRALIGRAAAIRASRAA